MATIKKKSTAINKYNGRVTYTSGRAGNIRYYTKNGVSYMRSATNASISSTRTLAQMQQRVTRGSVSGLWMPLKEALLGGFPNRKENQSVYNAFLAANPNAGVYLTKDEVQKSTQLALPLVISQGNGVLNSIASTNDERTVKSGIKFPSGLTISATTKIGDVASYLKNHPNESLVKVGDVITFVNLTQKDIDGVYRVEEYHKTVVLDPASEELWPSNPAEGMCFDASKNLYFEADPDGKGACGWIVNRDAKYSYSKMCQYGMTSIMDDFMSAEHFEEAATSYGDITAYVNRGGTDHPVGPVQMVSIAVSVALDHNAGKVRINGGTAGATAQAEVPAGSTVIIEGIPNAGAEFTTWSDSNTSNPRSIVVNDNTFLMASFESE